MIYATRQVPLPNRLIISTQMFIVGGLWECELICEHLNILIFPFRVSVASRFGGPLKHEKRCHLKFWSNKSEKKARLKYDITYTVHG